jgi:hypothetical protein
MRVRALGFVMLRTAGNVLIANRLVAFKLDGPPAHSRDRAMTSRITTGHLGVFGAQAVPYGRSASVSAYIVVHGLEAAKTSLFKEIVTHVARFDNGHAHASFAHAVERSGPSSFLDDGQTHGEVSAAMTADFRSCGRVGSAFGGITDFRRHHFLLLPAGAVMWERGRSGEGTGFLAVSLPGIPSRVADSRSRS